MSEEPDWTQNYFNYFTEIEEHFRVARGSGMFLLSTIDWALIESWKNAGVPLAAVLRGIDAAFEKWRSRKSKVQMVNSLAFCAQAVMTEAQVMAGGETARTRAEPAPPPPPFPLDELRAYLRGNAETVRRAGFEEVAASLERLEAEAEQHFSDLEEFERRLTVLEEKLLAEARTQQSEDDLLAARRELDSQLRPYRGKMSAAQLGLLEKQVLERNLLDRARLPRLSLFYMH